MKKCSVCKQEKSLADFPVNYVSTDGYLRIARRCLACARINDKKRSPESRKKEHLKHIHGITEETIKRIIKDQDGKCGGCGCLSRKLVIDHNHKTQEIRGMLCGNCNMSVGLMGDNPNHLRKLANYIENPPAKLTLADYIEGMA